MSKKNNRTQVLKIVYENDDIICINKKAGIPSQPDMTGSISVFDEVKSYLNSEIFILNRLDRPVSGIVVFAKNKKAARIYSPLISSKETVKTYFAIVENKPDKNEALLENNIIKKGKKAYISSDNNKGKKAILSYKYIGKGDRYHYLQINLITGRFHQIRAQLANIGCIIKGDIKYGAKRTNKDKSICLHAYEINFKTPEKSINITADLPKSVLWDDLQRAFYN